MYNAEPAPPPSAPVPGENVIPPPAAVADHEILLPVVPCDAAVSTTVVAVDVAVTPRPVAPLMAAAIAVATVELPEIFGMLAVTTVVVLPPSPIPIETVVVAVVVAAPVGKVKVIVEVAAALVDVVPAVADPALP